MVAACSISAASTDKRQGAHTLPISRVVESQPWHGRGPVAKVEIEILAGAAVTGIQVLVAALAAGLAAVAAGPTREQRTFSTAGSLELARPRMARTRMEPRQVLGHLGYRSKFHTYHQPFPVSGWAWNVRKESTNSKDLFVQNIKFRVNKSNFSKKRPTPNTATDHLYPSRPSKPISSLKQIMKYWSWVKILILSTMDIFPPL